MIYILNFLQTTRVFSSLNINVFYACCMIFVYPPPMTYDLEQKKKNGPRKYVGEKGSENWETSQWRD